MKDEYRIIDEPRPGALEQLAVRPMWPLLAMMLAGGWLAWPWFVINGIAVGSPTRTRELAWVAISIAGTFALVAILLLLHDAGLIETRLHIQIALLVILGWKLGTAYLLDMWQSRTFEVYEYYGGVVRNGMSILIAGVVLRPLIIDLSDNLIWKIIVSGGVLS